MATVADEACRTIWDVARRAAGAFAVEADSLRLIHNKWNVTFSAYDQAGCRYAIHLYTFFDQTVAIGNRKRWIESEIWWLRQVRATADLDVPEPVTASSGEYVIEYELANRTVPVAVLKWVTGRRVTRLTSRHLRQIGQATAKLHQASQSLTSPAWLLRGRVDDLGADTQGWIRNTFSGYSAAAGDLANDVIELVLDTMSRLDTTHAARLLIHADLHRRNVVFNRGRIGIIDFGDCGWGSILYDFAVTLDNLISPSKLAKEALFSGYREHRPLTDQAEQNVDSFILLRQIQDTAAFLTEGGPESLTSSAAIQARLRHMEELLRKLT